MSSYEFSELNLTRPEVTSRQFTEQLEVLEEELDDTISSLLVMLAASTNQSVEEIQAELDEMEDGDEDEEVENDAIRTPRTSSDWEEDPDIMDLVARFARLQI